MAGRLHGQVIWITGASSGVGEGMARVFHREGAELILSARREKELERVRSLCDEGAGVQILPFDVTDPAAREEAVQEVLAWHPRLDVLVNNAGIGQRSLAKDTLLEVERQIMEVDYFAPVALTKLVLPRMIAQQQGLLIVTSSVAGKHAVPYHTTYCAAKHALHGYFDTLRIEHLKDNIHCMLLVIAGIQSNVFEHALTGDGTPHGASTWSNDGGMSAEACAERVVDAIQAGEDEVVISIEEAMQAMLLRQSDPDAFKQRMASMMEWLEKS